MVQNRVGAVDARCSMPGWGARRVRRVVLGSAVLVMLAAPGWRGYAAGLPRIVNGTVTSLYPTTGALLLLNDPSEPARRFSGVTCSGTLIGCSTFLTAAHCVCDSVGADCQGTNAPDASRYLVYFQHAGLFAVSKITVHPNYEFQVGGDLAVIALAESIDGVTPTPLNAASSPVAGASGTIVGFGRTGGTASTDLTAGVKRVGQVTIGDCAGVAPSNTHVCWRFDAPVGSEGLDSNTCQGDSGGPLFLNVGGTDALAGVTSGGTSATCLPQDLSFDTNLYRYVAWVRSASTGGLGQTACGTLAPVGATGAAVFEFQGDLDDTTTSRHHSITVPSGAASLRVTLTGETESRTVQGALTVNDFDLYLRRGAAATLESFDCESKRFSQVEACEVATPGAGTWSILVNRLRGSGMYQVTATAFGRPCVTDVDCNDASSCTTDHCDLGTSHCVNQADVAADCRQPTAPKKSSLTVKDKDDDSKNALTWNWTKGSATSIDALGDPLTSTNYDLCVYDDTGGAVTLRMHTRIPAGGTCGGKPCWKATANGFKYSNPDVLPTGIKTLQLKAGTDGKAAAKVQGKGSSLGLPALPFAAPVTVQLKSSDGQCWGAGFSAPTRNDSTQFKAKSD